MDDDEVAFKEKQKAGMFFSFLFCFFLVFSLLCLDNRLTECFCSTLDAKAMKDMQEKAKGKGPMNAGNQGIKKSGKK